MSDAAWALVTQAREAAGALDGMPKADARQARLRELTRSPDLDDRLAAAIYRSWKAADFARKKRHRD